MQCPHLVEWVDWVILVCKSGKRPYVPSFPELKDYCKSKNHGKCPFFVSADEFNLNFKVFAEHAMDTRDAICNK